MQKHCEALEFLFDLTLITLKSKFNVFGINSVTLEGGLFIGNFNEVCGSL